MGYYRFSFVFLIIALFACKEKTSSTASVGDLEVIQVDISKAKKAKMSELFQAEVEYFWLKDNSADAQLNAGLHNIIFYKDKVITMDVFGCNCLQVFNRETGEFISKIKAYGEGPGKYIEFDDFEIVDDEIVLLGVYPFKIMWFSFDGELLREQKLKEYLGSGAYDEKARRYYFDFPHSREPGKFSVRSLSQDFKDTLNYFPYDPEEYYGNYSSRDNFFKSPDGIYLGRAFNDTIYVAEGKQLNPKLLLDFGPYRQSIDELKKNDKELDGLEMLNFINKRAKFYFSPHNMYVDDSHFYVRLTHESNPYIIYHNRLSGESHTIEGRLENDLDEAYDIYGIQYHFGMDKVGVKIDGKTLYQMLYDKKKKLGEEAFNEYINGKGRNFAKAAVAAKDSENYVLLVYTMK